MKKISFKLITFAILYFILLSSIEAQNLPDWVKKPSENTETVIYVVGRGEDKSLDGAKRGAYRDIEIQLFNKEFKQFNIYIDLSERKLINQTWVDGQGEWLNDNAQLIDEFIIKETTKTICYVYYAIPKVEIDTLINGLIEWFVPALKAGSIDQAIYSAAIQLVSGIPRESKIAVISVDSSDREMGEFVLEEITGYFSSVGTLQLFDRKSLDSIRKEQGFQMTGDVDDKSAISIGKFTGANIVITGSITGTGTTRRLRFKALDVKTARILLQTSDRF